MSLLFHTFDGKRAVADFRHLKQSRDTALNRASENGHIDCLRLLVEAGADTEAKNHVRDWRIESQS